MSDRDQKLLTIEMMRRMNEVLALNYVVPIHIVRSASNPDDDRHEDGDQPHIVES